MASSSAWVSRCSRNARSARMSSTTRPPNARDTQGEADCTAALDDLGLFDHLDGRRVLTVVHAGDLRAFIPGLRARWARNDPKKSTWSSARFRARPRAATPCGRTATAGLPPRRPAHRKAVDRTAATRLTPDVAHRIGAQSRCAQHGSKHQRGGGLPIGPRSRTTTARTPDAARARPVRVPQTGMSLAWALLDHRGTGWQARDTTSRSASGRSGRPQSHGGTEDLRI